MCTNCLAFSLQWLPLVRGWWNADQQAIRLSLWMLVALLLALFYPARQTADLVWMLIPLWTLAALELSRHLDLGGEDRLETTGVMIFTVLLLAFAWMDLGALSITPIPSQQGTIRMLLFFGALLLLILSVVLVGFGWSGTHCPCRRSVGSGHHSRPPHLWRSLECHGTSQSECDRTMELIPAHRPGGFALTDRR